MSNKHILIVSADVDISQILAEKIIGPAEYTVQLAKDIQTAKKSFRSKTPDLVILDTYVENGAGIAFAKDLIRYLPVVPIIVTTKEDRAKSMEIAFELGAVDCIFQPLDPQVVLNTVQRVLYRNELVEKYFTHRYQDRIKELHSRLDVLEKSKQASLSIASSLDLDQVIMTVVDAAVGITGAEEGSLLIFEVNTGELYLRAARHLNEEFVRIFCSPIKDNLADEVIRTGQPIFLNEDTPHKINDAYLVCSLIYVPLCIQDRVIGVLGVNNRTRSQTFHEQHLALLSTLADYAAIAIENSLRNANNKIERDKLETILTSIGDGVIVVDDDFRVIYANRSTTETFNIIDREFDNQRIDQIINNKQLIDMLQKKDIEYPYHCEITLDDSRVVNAQVSKIPEVGFAVTMQDITYLKELDRIKSDFVNTVSHDLRSPLTAILGYVDLITRVGPVNDRQDEYIKRVQVSVRNITVLINDLLELGRIESGFDARKEFVPLSEIINFSIDSLGSSLIQKNHKLTLEIPDNIEKVFGDPTRLRQLVDNLLSNAIRYTPERGHIRISLQSENNQIIFQVQDTGPGIPTSDQAYIFDKFYRASNIQQDIPGSGLGLAIVKTIVENHQGRVWVDSIVGQGSTFTVVLPTAEDDFQEK